MSKSRYWITEVYPESCIPDWIDHLTLTGLPIAISPIHDRDTFPDGTLKKSHYHVLLCWDGPTTYKVAKEVCDDIGATIPIRCLSVKGSYDYWIHLNNPDKYQYDDNDRINLNGFDVNNYTSLTTSEEVVLIKYIKAFIRKNNINELWTLSEWLEDDDLQAFQYVCTHTLLFKALLDSRRNILNPKK